MPWSCVQCSTENDNDKRFCGNCGAKLPFLPPSSEVEVEKREQFRVPREGELTATLRHGLDNLLAGHLAPAEFCERLHRAQENVPLVFQSLLQDLQEAAAEVPQYGEGVETSLLDCQALFLSGLDEMARFGSTNDPFHLRFGWLLVEKGEEEYLRIARALKKDAQGDQFSGGRDILGHLAHRFQMGEISSQEYVSTLNEFADSAEERLARARELLQDGVEAALSFEAEGEECLEEANQCTQRAADELGGLILNLYQPQ